MKLGSDFFDYEKNLTNMLNNKSKIEIYATPNKKALRKKSEDDKSFHNNHKIYDIKKTDSLSLYEGRRRGFSHRLRRNNDTDLIISDISKDEGSDNRTLFNGKHATKISSHTIFPHFTYKSVEPQESPGVQERDGQIEKFCPDL